MVGTDIQFVLWNLLSHRPTSELEAAPSSAFLAKGGLLRSKATASLLFLYGSELLTSEENLSGSATTSSLAPRALCPQTKKRPRRGVGAAPISARQFAACAGVTLIKRPRLPLSS